MSTSLADRHSTDWYRSRHGLLYDTGLHGIDKVTTGMHMIETFVMQMIAIVSSPASKHHNGPQHGRHTAVYIGLATQSWLAVSS